MEAERKVTVLFFYVLFFIAFGAAGGWQYIYEVFGIDWRAIMKAAFSAGEV